jgi:hypothetical protein
MDFRDLLELGNAEAIANTISSTEVAVWRRICRRYSEKFSTPLHLCLDGTIPAEDVILAYFESELEGYSEDDHIEQILDQIYSLEDPNYQAQKDQSINDDIKKYEREEADRIAAGRPIHKAMKEEAPLAQTKQEEIKQKSGGINLAYLAKEEEKNDFSFED